jgi:hypothetical protein
MAAFLLRQPDLSIGRGLPPLKNQQRSGQLRKRFQIPGERVGQAAELQARI